MRDRVRGEPFQFVEDLAHERFQVRGLDLVNTGQLTDEQFAVQANNEFSRAKFASALDSKDERAIFRLIAREVPQPFAKLLDDLSLFISDDDACCRGAGISARRAVRMEIELDVYWDAEKKQMGKRGRRTRRVMNNSPVANAQMPVPRAMNSACQNTPAVRA